MATTAWYVVAVWLLWSVRGQNMECPASCSCLGSLVDCSKMGLIAVPKDLPVWVEILELQQNDIPDIPVNAFVGLHGLKKLDLSHNQLRMINASAFSHLKQLRELKIQHNHLIEIPDLGFQPNLTHLSLHHNEIYTINGSVLKMFPALRVLDLNHNRIVDIPVETFPNGTKLQHLYLNSNRIVNLEKGALDNLTSLEWCKLNKNRLSTIPKDLFRKLHALKYLELNRNALEQIDGLSFLGLDSLKVLKLRSNNITNLLDGAFWGLKSIQNLQLDHNNISRIAKGWLYGLSLLQHLSLSHNCISEVEDDGWEFCENLRGLDLSHNRLQSITKETFAKLKSLQNLKLGHNMISYIEEGAFRYLSNLHILEMNHNEISWTIEDTSGAFMGLDRLVRLGLAHNHIKSIAKRTFAGLTRLEVLDLAHNPITSIQENALSGLKHLQDIQLNSSSLLCDCSLQWFPMWLVTSGFQQFVTARCGHPEWLKGKLILEADPDNFTCDDFPKPYITEEPLTQFALKGENVTLVCKAASSSNSQTTFQWRKDNKLLHGREIENYAHTKTNGIIEYASLLHIRNIQDLDEGRYQCVISNHFGSVYSQKARITVHVFPTFTKTPSDIMVKAGSTARLECAAKGQPPPEIAWQKDGGGDDFPAARERRMHVMPTDDVFFIVSIKTSDMGMYTCTAQNAAGIIMANASLTVLETPSFVRPMEDKETRAGDTAVLECMASGSPKPKLTWLKNDGPLVATERHFFTANDQLLIIVQTQPSDSGKYTCEMSNTMGTERDSSYLTILPAAPPVGSSSSDDDSTTTGIIIIAVVCCVVGTSLVWVIIIYHTRKRADDYAPTNTDETTVSGELAPFGAYGQGCTEDLKASTPHLFTDDHSDHSSKDSGTGDSAQQSSHELLPQDDAGSHTLILPNDECRLMHSIRGSSTGSLLGPSSDTASQSSPSTRTTSSGCSSSRSSKGVISRFLSPASRAPPPSGCSLPSHVRWNSRFSDASRQDSTFHLGSNATRELATSRRSFSAEQLSMTGTPMVGFVLPSSRLKCLATEPGRFPVDTSGRDSGFSTFQRDSHLPCVHSWSMGSLQCGQPPKEAQNDSGSFSVMVECCHPEQQPLVHSQLLSHCSSSSSPTVTLEFPATATASCNSQPANTRIT